MQPDEEPHDRTVHFHTAPVRRPRGKAPRLIVIAACYVIVIVGAVIAQLKVDAAYAKAPATSPAATPSAAATSPTATRPAAPAAVPGWQAVVADTGGLAYDVPPRWDVSAAGAGVTMRDGTWRLPVTMLAGYLDGYCGSGSSRALAGVATAPEADAATAATETARHVADWAYRSAGPRVSVGTPATATAGGLTGELVTARVSVTKPGRCEPPTALVTVFALADKAHHDSLVALAYADQRFTGAVEQADLATIVTSLRPVK
jgi:hypothetical protein